MEQVRLRKLISKKRIKDIILGLIDSVDRSVYVIDDDGQILAGSEAGSGTKRFSVDIEGQTIGHVVGGDQAGKIAALISHLADLAMDRQSLANEALDKYKEITLLYDMSEKISSSLDSSKVSQLIIDEIKNMVTGDNVTVFRFNEESKMLEAIALSGDEYITKSTVKPGEGIVGNVFLSKKAEIVNNVASDSRYIQGATPVSSMMCVPMMLKQRASGVIKVSMKQPVQYSAEDLKLFVILASHAAVAVENAWLYDRLADTFFSTVNALAETIERRDTSSSGHTKRVAKYSLAIGKTFGLTIKEMSEIRLTSILHDIGKIAIPDSILLKTDALTAQERITMNKHTEFGAEILKGIKQLKEVLPGIRGHHEKYDGTGFPDGLKGDKIPITARVLAVANRFDNMTAGTANQKAVTQDEAAEYIRKHAGTEFDPDVVRAFYKIYQDGKLS